MNLRLSIFLFGLIFIFSCGKDNDGGASQDTSANKIEFESSSYSMIEGDLDKAIVLKLEKPAESNITVRIEVTSLSNDISFRIASSPTTSNGILTAILNQGETESPILIDAKDDIDHISEEVSFTITNLSGGNAQVGNTSTTTLRISDKTANTPQYITCLPNVGQDTLDIATWNVRRFPQGPGTVDAMIQLVHLMDVDVIAIQEIVSTEDFDQMVADLPGWEGAWLNVTGDIDIGYLYKSSEITSFTPLSTLFDNDGFSFPREAVVSDIVHSSGISVKLINIHLKCCNDGAQRRETASSQMKIYVDMNLSDEEFIILGDFNDGITGNSPFANFLNDPENYFFADMTIATGNNQEWSYPSFPSHIDHILCSNELNSRFISSQTMQLEACVRGYDDIISDHRAVIARFK